MIRRVLFDIDDTLIDFTESEREALLLAYHDFGFEITPELLRCYREINAQLWNQYESGELPQAHVMLERHRRFLESVHFPSDAAAIEARYRSYLSSCCPLTEGCRGLLDYLSPKYRLYIVSNGFPDTQYPRLEKAGILGYFDGVFLSKELGLEKQEPGFYDKLRTKIPDFLPEESIMIGDHPTKDIVCASCSGLHTIWLNRNHAVLPLNCHPDFVINSLSEIKHIL